jgi:hypothetical protein
MAALLYSIERPEIWRWRGEQFDAIGTARHISVE